MIGTIFSGLSLYLQIKDKIDRNRQNEILLKIVANCFDMLKLSKDVHACFQEILYVHLSKYLNRFGKLSIEENSSHWPVVFEIYNTTYEQNNLHILIKPVEIKEDPEEELEDAISQFKNSKKLKEFICALAINRELKIFINSYSHMLNRVYETNSTITAYNEAFVTHGEFRNGMHTPMRRSFQAVMTNSDNSIKSMIEIIHRIILKMGK